MATYLLTEPAYIHGVYYTQGTTAVFSNDLPPALGWIPQDDDAKRAVEAQNKIRAKRGLNVSQLPTVDELVERLKLAGYSVTDPNEGNIKVSVDPERDALGALVVDPETGSPDVKKTK